MTDFVSPEVRSGIMRKVRGKNTSPEVVLRKALWKINIRGYRIHPKNIPGNPDILFPRKKLVIFVDGCFWHGCPTCYRRPKSNEKYWDHKLIKNIARDRIVEEQLLKSGFRCIRIWEHEVKENVKAIVDKINKELGKPF